MPDSPKGKYTTTADFYLSIAMGLAVVDNFSQINKFGRNTDIDTAAAEDIWSQGGTWAAPTTARTHNLVSSSLNDAAAGSGARTVEVYGLDANGVFQNETVTLNGTTDVATADTYTMIHRLIVRTAGATGSNEGTVTATAATDATVTAAIAIGVNQSQMAIFQIPANYNAYLMQYYGAMNRSSPTGASDMDLIIKPPGEVFQQKHHIGMLSAGTSHFSHYFVPPLSVDALSIIKLRADASANNIDVSGGFDVVLRA